MSATAQKLPLARATEIAREFYGLFTTDQFVRWSAAGSIRRRVAHLGDVEHVVIPRVGLRAGRGLFDEPCNLFFARIDDLVRDGSLLRHISATGGTCWGEKHRKVVDRHGVMHDIYLADGENWGPTLAIRTGPAEFSKMLVVSLRRHGYRNEGGYVWREADGQRVSVVDERAYFKLCGVAWCEPQDRRDEIGGAG